MTAPPTPSACASCGEPILVVASRRGQVVLLENPVPEGTFAVADSRATPGHLWATELKAGDLATARAAGTPLYRRHYCRVAA